MHDDLTIPTIAFWSIALSWLTGRPYWQTAVAVGAVQAAGRAADAPPLLRQVAGAMEQPIAALMGGDDCDCGCADCRSKRDVLNVGDGPIIIDAELVE
jgi:hypothetical protein